MRVWGRQYNTDGTYDWIEVDTDVNGFNDAVYVTALCQVLQLQLNESPFYSNYGIPAQPDIVSQIFPDYNVYLTQQRYAPYFASLKVTKVNALNQYDVPTPVYNIQVITQQGSVINLNVPIPT
jgi:hypothetical protein